MLNFLNKNRVIFLFFLLIVLFSGVVTLFNLGLHKEFVGTDSGLSCSFPDTLINLVYYAWDNLSAPGKASVTSFLSFLWINSIFGLFKIGFNPIVINRLLYFSYFAVSGIGVFFFLVMLIKKYSKVLDKDKIYFGAFTGSLLYMFNHFTMQMVSLPIMPYHISYMLLPWIMGLLIYNLQVKTTFFSIFLFSIICLLLLSGNISNTISIIFFLFVSYLFFVFIVKNNHTKPYLFLVISFLLILFLSSYIYLPMIGLGSNPYGNVSSLNFLGSLNFNSKLTSFLNLFRLGGVMIWKDFLYYPFYMQNDFLLFLGYLIPILAIISLLIPKGRKVKIFFGIVAVISLFLAKGSHPPLEGLFLYFYTHIPYFGMYRSVYCKFIFFAILSYSILVGFFVTQSFAFLKSRCKKFSYIVIVIPLAICLYAWPFFTNNIVKKDYLTVIPEDYKQLSKVLEDDSSDFKILSVPPSVNGRNLLLKWSDDNKYIGTHTDKFFLDKPVLDSYWFIEKELYGLTSKDAWGGIKFEKIFLSILNYSNIFNVKYVFLHKDFVDKYDFKSGGGAKEINGQRKADIIKSALKRQEDIGIIGDSKYYTLYKVPYRYFLPHFYTPQDVIISDQTVKSLPQIVSQPDYKTRSAIYFNDSSKLKVEGLKVKEEKSKVLGEIKQYNFREVIVPETKVDKVKKIDEEIKKIGQDIKVLQKKKAEGLSKKEKLRLKNLSEIKNGLEQRKKNLIEDTTQYFAEVDKADNYDLSFQLSSCQEKALPLLDNKPLVAINGLDYEIPYEIIGGNGTVKYRIKTDDNCFVQIKDIPLSQGKIKIATNYILGLNNLVFSKDYPKEIKTPVLEFRKINPTKYIVRVHQAKDSFPLVFSESFHKGWKAYLSSNVQKFGGLKVNTNDYKILEGNEEDQATKAELADYIDKGWISTLGDLKEKEIKHKRYENGKEKLDHIEKYKIDFISKNFKDTIQNDNLPKGHIWDTWLGGKLKSSKVESSKVDKIKGVFALNKNVEQLPEEDHLMANGYANSWFVDPAEVCKTKGFCHKNPDGSYDFEMVVEFWPQRLFYLGLFISGMTLLGCLGYLGYDWRRRRNYRSYLAEKV